MPTRSWLMSGPLYAVAGFSVTRDLAAPWSRVSDSGQACLGRPAQRDRARGDAAGDELDDAAGARDGERGDGAAVLARRVALGADLGARAIRVHEAPVERDGHEPEVVLELEDRDSALLRGGDLEVGAAAADADLGGVEAARGREAPAAEARVAREEDAVHVEEGLVLHVVDRLAPRGRRGGGHEGEDEERSEQNEGADVSHNHGWEPPEPASKMGRGGLEASGPPVCVAGEGGQASSARDASPFRARPRHAPRLHAQG